MEQNASSLVLDGRPVSDMVARRILAGDDEDLQWRLAANRFISCAIAEEVFTYDELRRPLASNPATPEHVQVQLRGLDDQTIDFTLAKNTNLARALQGELMGDGFTHYFLASNTGLASDLRVELASSSDPDVRREAVTNGHLPESVQLCLAQDPDYGVRIGVASSTHLYPSAAAAVLEGAGDYLRQLVASNPVVESWDIDADLPVRLFSLTDSLRAFKHEYLRNCDAETRGVLEKEFSGSLRELRETIDALAA